METNERVFKIHSYGLAQLALMYCPELSKKSASSKLRKWLLISESLQAKLQEAGYRKGNRIFTPRQVRLITEHLGEP